MARLRRARSALTRVEAPGMLAVCGAVTQTANKSREDPARRHPVMTVTPFVTTHTSHEYPAHPQPPPRRAMLVRPGYVGRSAPVCFVSFVHPERAQRGGRSRSGRPTRASYVDDPPRRRAVAPLGVFTDCAEGLTGHSQVTAGQTFSATFHLGLGAGGRRRPGKKSRQRCYQRGSGCRSKMRPGAGS
jgi:hypothetical protein